MSKKRCTKCKKWKNRTEYSPDAWQKDGLNSRCKQCRAATGREKRALQPKILRIKLSDEERKRHSLKSNRQWRLKNPEKAKIACRNWYRRIKNKITVCLGNRVYESLNGNLDRKILWEILGYTYEEFAKHIEKHFQSGMTWNNHGEWEIDHIIPISFFNFQSPNDVEFKMCWKLENIQPLWKHQNKQKGDKILIA